MYTDILILVAIILPIPVVVLGGVIKKQNPYKVVLEAILFTGGCLAIGFATSQLFGVSIGKEVEMAGEEMVKMMTTNPQFLEILKGTGMQTPDLATLLLATYNQITNQLPAILLIIATLSAYFSYRAITPIAGTARKDVQLMAPIREFTLPRQGVFGWFIIYFGSWLLSTIFKTVGTITFVNIDVIFTFMFTIQGIAVLMYFLHIKRVPWIIGVILTGVILITPFGRTAFFILGLIDMMFTLRGKIRA